MKENSGLNPNKKFINQLRSNTKSDLIEITEDKLENILRKHLNKVIKVNSWITPLLLSFSISATLLTADFKDFASIDKSHWKDLFVLCLVGSSVWTIIAVIRALICLKKSSIDYLIKEIKNDHE